MAVPVPDSGIPCELVEAARDVVESNRKPARGGRRFWELTGGIAYCGVCGKTMCANHSAKTKKGRLYVYDYYCCFQRNRYGLDACANSYRARAGELEATIWNLVSGLLKDPERLRAGLEELIEEERRAARGNPGIEAETWTKKLTNIDSKRSAYQYQQAGISSPNHQIRSQPQPHRIQLCPCLYPFLATYVDLLTLLRSW